MPNGAGERIQRALPALLVFGALPFLCAPGLLWGEWVWYRDAWQTLAPLKQRGAEALARGELPLWTADGGAGMPLLANPSPGYAYPLSILLAWLPLGWGLSLLSALHVTIAGLGARALARALGAGTGGAWIAGVAYAVSGPVVSHLATFSHGVACAWIPIALLGALHLARDGRWGWGAIGAFALAMVVLGGEAQLALYTAAAMAMVVLGAAPAGGRGRAVGRLAAIAPLALLVAAVQILPTAEWLGHIGAHDPAGPPAAITTGRTQPWSTAANGSWRPDVLLLEWCVPGAFGNQAGGYWGGDFGVTARYVLHVWMGLVVTVLAWLGCAQRAARPAVGWSVAGGWLALGKFGGLYWLCYHLLPGFASFRYPDKALPFLALGVAVCAGFGWRRWSSTDVEPERRRRWERIVWVAGGAWVLLAVVTALAGPLWSVPGVLDDALLLSAAPWRAPALRAAFLAAGGVVILTGTSRGVLGRAALPVAAVWIAVSGAAVNHAAAPTAPTAEFIAPGATAARLGPAPPERWRLISIAGSRPLAGLTRDVKAFQLRQRRRYVAYGALFEGRATIDSWETSQLRGFAALVRGANDFRWLGALGVRDVVTAEDFASDGGDALQSLGAAGDAHCYRNRHALPRARLAVAVELVDDDAALKTRLTAPDFLHARTVCLRRADAAPYEALLRQLDPRATGLARIVQDDGNALTIATESSGPALCVVADLHYPGWSAQVDGAPAPLLAANGYFRGVVVPAGRHTVTMRISNGHATLGAWLSGLGLLLVAGLIWWDRRRGNGVPG